MFLLRFFIVLLLHPNFSTSNFCDKDGYCESEDKSAFLHSNQENEELKQYKTDELTLEHESVKEQEQITEATKEDVKAKDEIEKVQEEETNVSEVMLEDRRIKQKRDEINERKPLEMDGLLEPCTVTVEGGQLYRNMIVAAGYDLNSASLMKKYHCQSDHDNFLQNGFFKTTGLFKEKEVSIISLMPSQAIQAHAHDDDEHIFISHGSLIQFYWPNGPGQPENRTLSASATGTLITGLTHALFAGHEGVVYHESLESDRKSTWFAPATQQV